jgi:hypothetical protein
MKQFYTTDDKEFAEDVSAYVNETFAIFKRWPTHVEEDRNKIFKYAVVVDEKYETDVWYYSTTIKKVQDAMCDFKAGYYWRKKHYE